MDIHAIERAKERYGLELTKADLGEIRRQIVNRSAMLIEFGPYVSRWAVKHGGDVLIVLYDDKKQWIVTVLPRDSQVSGASRTYKTDPARLKAKRKRWLRERA